MNPAESGTAAYARFCRILPDSRHETEPHFTRALPASYPLSIRAVSARDPLNTRSRWRDTELAIVATTIITIMIMTMVIWLLVE